MNEQHLKELKQHLRIDYDSDDKLLQVYYLTACADVETIAKRKLYGDICTSEEDLPPQIWQFIMLRIGDYYMQREMSSEKKYEVYYTHILDAFVNYGETVNATTD